MIRCTKERNFAAPHPAEELSGLTDPMEEAGVSSPTRWGGNRGMFATEWLYDVARTGPSPRSSA